LAGIAESTVDWFVVRKKYYSLIKKIRFISLFGWLVRFVAGSWRSTASWFVWEKNNVLTKNLRSFMISQSQTNRPYKPSEQDGEARRQEQEATATQLLLFAHSCQQLLVEHASRTRHGHWKRPDDEAVVLACCGSNCPEEIRPDRAV